MSTTFGLFKMKVETYEDGCIKSEYTSEDYVEIARRSSGGLSWKNKFEIVAHHLDDSVPVYPLDNSAQGIYTVGDIRREIISQ